MGAISDAVDEAGSSIVSALNQRKNRQNENKTFDVIMKSLKDSMGEEEFHKSGIGDLVDATKGQDNRLKKVSDFLAVKQAVQKQETPDEKRFKDTVADLAKQGISIDTSYKDFSQISKAVKAAQDQKDKQKQDAQINVGTTLNNQRADLSLRNSKEIQQGNQQFQADQAQQRQNFELAKAGTQTQDNPFAAIAQAVNKDKEQKRREDLNTKIVERGQAPLDTNAPDFMNKAQSAFAQPDLSKNQTLDEKKVKNKSQLITDDVNKIFNILDTSNVGLDKRKGLLGEAGGLFDQFRVSSNIPLLTANDATLSDLQSALGSLKRNASFTDAGKSLTQNELGIISPLLDITGKSTDRIKQDLGKFQTEWSRLSNLIDGKTTTGATNASSTPSSSTGSTIDKYFEGL